MPKVKISEYSTTNADNTDIEGINIAEGCAPSGINNAIRELMVHLKEFQTGASGDGFTFAGGTLMTGTNTLSGTNVLSGSTTAAFAAGTVSAPSIYASGDTNTGIFFPAADTIAFAEGGAEAMRIDSSGNVGIGVTPSAWLSTYKSIQFSNSSAVFGTTGETLVGTNIFVNSSDENKYITTDEASMYRQANGNHIFYSAASGTAGNTITFTSVLSVNRNTTLVLQGGTSTSGTGIAFPATQSASSDANTLDDYEEGTWTGTLKGITTDPTTPVTATGKYTKIGRQVTVSIYFNNVTTTGASGSAYISGLPFSEDGTRAVGTLAVYNFDLNTGTSAFCDVGTTSLFFVASKTNAAWQDILHNAGTTRFVRATATYFV